MDIKIFITDLAAYNEGRLVGKWLTLNGLDAESLQAEIDSVLKEGHELCRAAGLCLCSEHEEFFITDSETDGFKLDIGEYDSPFDLLKLTERLDGLEEDDIKKVEFAVDHLGDKLTDALDHYEDIDFYPDMTMRELAEQFVDDGLFGKIDDAIINYIDYDAIARDLATDYIETPDGVFRAN